jgi:hypothetical protein
MLGIWRYPADSAPYMTMTVIQGLGPFVEIISEEIIIADENKNGNLN